MALPNIPVPPFPNVPPLPGVPPLIRSANAVYTTVSSFYARSTFSTPPATEKWEIHNADGTIALGYDDYDSFSSIDFKREYRLSDYPQEEGAFQSYNKVQVPFDSSVLLVCGGSTERRAKFLNKLDAMIASIKLFTIITPEASYTNVSLERYNYRREATDGARLLKVELIYRQIRKDASANFTTQELSPMSPTETQSASAEKAISNGQVQAADIPNPPPAPTKKPVQ